MESNVNSVYLHKDDVKEILAILEELKPENDMVKIDVDTSSGIGAHTTATVNMKVGNYNGEFTTVISSVENW
jgi:glycerol-3-phosphate responsive antiterminator